jgi:hypothetical protein
VWKRLTLEHVDMSRREWNKRCVRWIKAYMECLFENRSVILLHNVKQRDLFGMYP